MTRAHFTLAAWFLLSGCGFLDQPAISGRRQDDGVSAFRDVGPIELCVGPARFVEGGGGGPTGVCQPDATPSRSCTTSANCGVRETCVCGRCSVQLCRTAADCPSHLSCGGSPAHCSVRCASNPAACSANEKCVGGVCIGKCARPSDCSQGETCQDGECIVFACGGTGPACSSGETCASQVRRGSLAAPAALAYPGNQTVLFAEIREGGFSQGILRAESSDGRRFVARPDEPVLRADGDRFSSPGAVRVGLETHLYVARADGSIARSVSLDGTTFSPVSTILLPTEAWEGERLGSPNPVVTSERTLLFFENASRTGIGVATSNDGNIFQKRATPILTTSDITTASWPNIVQVGSPAPVLVTRADRVIELRLFFSARGREVPGPEETPIAGDAGVDGGLTAPLNNSVGLATTLDLVDLTDLKMFPYNPTFGRIREFRRLEEHEPTVVRVGTRWQMYFESGEGVISFAVGGDS